MPAPPVSVGVPVYNGGRFLAETLESLRAQDHGDLEIVISDNASTDGTEEICRAAAAQDPRVRYHRASENRGAAWNYNRVLALARGELFKWAAADDVCEPGFVSACVDALSRGAGRPVLAFPATRLVDVDGRPLGPVDDANLDLRQPSPHERLRGLLRNRFEWHPVFGVVETRALRRSIGIGPFLYADIALLAELSLVGEFHRIDEPLFVRRYHDGRSVVANATWREQLTWYDPHAGQRAVLPQARLIRELLAVVARAPLSPAERVRCVGVVATAWALPHWRHVGGEVRRAIPQLTPARAGRS